MRRFFGCGSELRIAQMSIQVPWDQPGWDRVGKSSSALVLSWGSQGQTHAVLRLVLIAAGTHSATIIPTMRHAHCRMCAELEFGRPGTLMDPENPQTPAQHIR